MHASDNRCVTGGPLTHGERALLGPAADAVVANAFSDERDRIDRAIAEGAPGRTHDERFEAGVRRIGAALDALEATGRCDPRRHAGDDRRIVEYAVLFDAYYRSREDLDGLIVEQERAGDESVAAPFAADVADGLWRRGFTADAARRALALFFQIRRAFHLIDRALVGASPCMRGLRRDLWNGIFTRDIRLYSERLWSRMEDFSTLLLGETGAGKGAAAAAIGRAGHIPFDARTGRFGESFTRAFVETNLSGVPEPLLESELFGHRRGAFTGAVDDREGLFARCSPHGAIFLDEIGETSVHVQVKLLRVLQERTFVPVGDRAPQRFRGRVIAATNRPLAELRAGRMRDDLYHRLSSDVIVVPPLRQRLREDAGELPRLVAHVLERLLGEPAPDLVEDCCAAIEEQLAPDHPWHGNVRELEQCLRRLLLKGRYDAGPAAPTGRSSLLAPLVEEGFDARGLLAAYCRELHAIHGSYQRVADVVGLDPRTVRKYVGTAGGSESSGR